MSKKIGLALSGGGARGFAHVGVLNVFAEHNIHFDVIAGTSAGSIIGAALACGMTSSQISEMARRTGYTNTMRPSLSPRGILSNVPLGRLLARELPCGRFEDLKVPFGAVVYDLTAGEERLVSENGDLIPAIRASCAVPGIFCPLIGEDGHVLVDGGVSSPFPAAAVRRMGADIVIGVDVLSCGGTFMSQLRTGLGVAVSSSLSLIRSAAVAQHHFADIVVEPAVAHLRPDQIRKREEFIALGEEAARGRIAEIIELIDRAVES